MILVQKNLLLLGQVIPQVTFVARAVERELPLLLPEKGAWKLLNGPRLIFFELPLCVLPVLFPGVHWEDTNQRSAWSWHRGFRRFVFEGRRYSV